MRIDETTLIEIQDYINELDKQVGLSNETLDEIKIAISKHKKNLKSKYKPCGGCGANNPSDRCINCRHQF